MVGSTTTTTLSAQQEQQLQLLQKLLDGPAMAPPPGIKPNFVNPPDLDKEFYIDLILCLTISVLAVCMRVWTKARVMRKFQIEDWVCVLALAGFAGYCTEIFYTIHVGYTGVHGYNLQLKNLSKKLYHIRIELTTFGFVIFTVKLAILLQYLRVFCPSGIRDAIYWVCHTLIWLNFIFYGVSVFLLIFSCTPINKFWKPWIREGKCLDINAINLGAAFLNSASDISILIVPQHVIWKLQMSRAKKVGISAVFLTGALACVSSLIRVYYTFKLVHTHDNNYYVSVLGLWTLPEITSAFLAICLPLAPKFFDSFNLRSSLRSSRSQRYQRHDRPINFADNHNWAAGAPARGAKKNWTDGTGETADNINTELSEFQLVDTPHIVQSIDISTKYENK